MAEAMNLKNKKILLGISGGIAAYKCAELVRRWIQNDAEVEIIMTEAAQKFITPLTMETLINKPVHTDLFPERQFSTTVHIDLADWADVVLIAPATANIISKIALGQGNDLLTTVCLAAWKKTIIAPAMNSNMWANPAVQQNLKTLQKRGYVIIQPMEGDLACGYTGIGRLPDANILDYWLTYFIHPKTILKGKTVLVTAGRTEEEIDPVRVITNRSSGKMGFALAQESYFHGAKVILVTGPHSLSPLPGIEYVQVGTALEMHQEVEKRIQDVDIMIASAAVSDYRSKDILFRKMKRTKKNVKLDLVSNPDIIAGIGKQKGQRILVGFALETDNEEKNALEKMHKKNLDMIVLNNPVESGSGFATNTNKVTIYFRKGKPLDLPLMSKTEVAENVLTQVVGIIGKSSKK
jgi:phosphopantothenoylcysteine decarboxylase/phosphopantothenate--cysteine ligase